MLRSDDLLVLLEVARSGSFSGAAATLGIDYSTAARRVGTLESSLGQPVVVRSVHGCEITDFGRRLLEQAERIERAVEEVRHLQGSLTAGEQTFSGLVRVHAPEAFGACFVAPVLARMHRDFPDVTLELVTATRPLVQGSLADIEIGVGMALSRRVESFPLADYTLGLYASPEYLEHKGTPGTPAELSEHTLIYYIDALLRVSDLDLIDRLFPVGAVHIGSTSVHSQLAATRAGGGIGVLPNFLAGRESGLVRLLSGQVGVHLQLTVALAPRVLRRPPAGEVLRRLQSEVGRRRIELLPESSETLDEFDVSGEWPVA